MGRRVEKELRELEQNLELIASIETGQLALAISLGVKLQRIENGMTLREKIEAAESKSDDEPPNVMQRALFQQLHMTVDDKATRGEISYQIIQDMNRHHNKFFRKLDSAFQDRFCGGPLSRFKCVPAFSPTTHGVLTGIGILFRIVKYVVVAVFLMFVLAILLAIFAPKTEPDKAAVSPQSPADVK